MSPGLDSQCASSTPHSAWSSKAIWEEGSLFPKRGKWGRLAGHPHEADTCPQEADTRPQEAALGMAARPAHSEVSAGHATDGQRQPQGPAERQAGRGPALGSGGASGTLRRADLLADPGVRGRRGGRETLLWFCGQGGNILRIFRGWIGNWPHTPQALPARAQPLEHAI